MRTLGAFLISFGISITRVIKWRVSNDSNIIKNITIVTVYIPDDIFYFIRVDKHVGS